MYALIAARQRISLEPALLTTEVQAMPTYHFNVQDGVKYKDLNGTILVDDEAALAEA